MYNRYIPQPDGTYSRRQYQDTPQPAKQEPRPREAQWHPQPPPCPPPNPEPAPQIPPCPQQTSRPMRSNSCRQRQPQRPAPPPPRPESPPPRQDTHVLGFLKALLPKEFDTGDLMIVLLLLLMSADCQEDHNSALLTLVLYLFL